jgi:hypothetical protein
MDASADTQCSTVAGEVITAVREIFSRVEDARRLRYTLDTAPVNNTTQQNIYDKNRYKSHSQVSREVNIMK